MGHKVEMAACGSRHTAVLTSAGEVHTFGDKENGVCGVGDTDGYQYIPKLVEGLKGKQIGDVGGGALARQQIREWFSPQVFSLATELRNAIICYLSPRPSRQVDRGGSLPYSSYYRGGRTMDMVGLSGQVAQQAP